MLLSRCAKVHQTGVILNRLPPLFIGTVFRWFFTQVRARVMMNRDSRGRQYLIVSGIRASVHRAIERNARWGEVMDKPASGEAGFL